MSGQQKSLFIWGHHAALATLSRVPELVMEFWVKEGTSLEQHDVLIDLAKRNGITVQSATAKALDRMSENGVHQGVVLKRRPPSSPSLEQWLADRDDRNPPPLLLVLDQVQDPQNFGACLRVADAAGADAIIVPRDHTAPLSGTVAKSASGALDSNPIINVPNLARALTTLADAGIWLVGTAHDGAETFYQSDLRAAVGLVFGSESRGMRRLTREKCDQIVRIPMAGSVESLNISTAVAIGMFEANRQRSV